MMTVGSHAVKILSVPIAGRKQESPVLLLLLWPKQQRKDVWGVGGGGGGGAEWKRLVDRLGAWIWDKAWRQRKLENSSGWNKGCAPCTPHPHKTTPLFLQQCSWQMGVRVGGLTGWGGEGGGIKTLPFWSLKRVSLLRRWGAERHLWRGSRGVWRGCTRANVKGGEDNPPRSIHLYPLRSVEGAARRERGREGRGVHLNNLNRASFN